MSRFPYITDYVNDVFSKERTRWNFIWLRPPLLVVYFFLRTISFPLQFAFHRRPYGCESYLIDRSMALGMKYLATYDAAELLLRHVQIEPLLYRHILARKDAPPPADKRKLNGIDGDYAVEDLKTIARNNTTLGHDELSYELLECFDKEVFLENLDYIRSSSRRTTTY